MIHVLAEVAKSTKIATVSNYHKLFVRVSNTKATRKLKSIRVAGIRST